MSSGSPKAGPGRDGLGSLMRARVSPGEGGGSVGLPGSVVADSKNYTNLKFTFTQKHPKLTPELIHHSEAYLKEFWQL